MTRQLQLPVIPQGFSIDDLKNGFQELSNISSLAPPFPFCPSAKYLDGMIRAQSVARKTRRGKIASRAIQQEIATFQLQREVRFKKLKRDIFGYTCFLAFMSVILIPLFFGVIRASEIEAANTLKRNCALYAQEMNQYAADRGFKNPCQ